MEKMHYLKPMLDKEIENTDAKVKSLDDKNKEKSQKKSSKSTEADFKKLEKKIDKEIEDE